MPAEHGETYMRSDGLYDWRVQSVNGQIVATSGGQGFTNRHDAREALEREFPTIEIREEP